MECFARGNFQSSFSWKAQFLLCPLNVRVEGNSSSAGYVCSIWLPVVSITRRTGAPSLCAGARSLQPTIQPVRRHSARVLLLCRQHPSNQLASLGTYLKIGTHYKSICDDQLELCDAIIIPVPRLSRRPPRNSLVANRSWFQMSNSRARSFNSWWVMSSKMKVQFQTGFDVLRQMLVLCFVVLPFSGIKVLRKHLIITYWHTRYPVSISFPFLTLCTKHRCFR